MTVLSLSNLTLIASSSSRSVRMHLITSDQKVSEVILNIHIDICHQLTKSKVQTLFSSVDNIKTLQEINIIKVQVKHMSMYI